MKLKFGMVGGGNGAFIGDVHRRGAIMDNYAVLAAGCFTRNPALNRQTGDTWGVSDPARIYADYREMAEQEAKRSDGIDFTVIVTPTDTHYEIAKCFLEHGIHVVCDKPVTVTPEEALVLRQLASERNLQFGVTYTYASYAVIRQAREMIASGKIGNIINIIGEYPQDWVISDLSRMQPGDPLPWRLDASRSKTACVSDIGTHLEALAYRMTGLRPERVLARFTAFGPSTLDHDIQILLNFENNVPGMFWASQIAAGCECDISLRVFGDEGALSWSHKDPMKLQYTKLDGTVQTLTANKRYCAPVCTEQCRLPAGSPEGMYEAFGNIYSSFCLNLLAEKGEAPPTTRTHPTIEDGIAGLRFVEACVQSNASGNIWVPVVK